MNNEHRKDGYNKQFTVIKYKQILILRIKTTISISMNKSNNCCLYSRKLKIQSI